MYILISLLCRNGEDVFTAPAGSQSESKQSGVTVPEIEKQKTKMMSEYLRQKSIQEQPEEPLQAAVMVASVDGGGAVAESEQQKQRKDSRENSATQESRGVGLT